jgi:ribosomal-protein-alanine N-acetyltransferase
VRFTGDDVWEDIGQAEEFLSGVREGVEEEELFGWSIVLKRTGDVIGTCALFDCDINQQVAEVSYELHPDYWNNGFTRELLPSLLEFGFNELGLNRVSAFVDSRNLASLKLLDRVGFQREGLMRESWIGSDGQAADDVVLGLLRKEWLTE